MECTNLIDNTIIVHLNGYLDTDDRLALKSITVQMHLENAANGKVFGSFAENLAFLLACLKSGDKHSKSVIYILEEFDLFCTHHNQTLLYNLLDVSQSAQAPICVLGITCRLDVVELLEKRVKSRFSHRQVFIFPNGNDFPNYLNTFQNLLSIPSSKELKIHSERVNRLKLLDATELTFPRMHYDPSKYKFSKKLTDEWNKNIEMLSKHPGVVQALQNLYDFNVNQSFLKTFIFRLVCKLQDTVGKSQLNAEQIIQLANTYKLDDKVELLCSMSVLELSLIITIKHHCQIYDRDPFNFEIIFTRFGKFAKTSTCLQGIERPVALKAFERLRNIEFIAPLTASNCKVQKEFEMHRLLLTYEQINSAVQRYQALPTDVSQWSQSSLI